jgi:NADH:ubiquinone oxidoreductase subunit D
MEQEPEAMESAVENNEVSSRMRVIGWFSFGMAVAALGILVGRELRSRYKFRRRTPYDFYANAGENQSSEFGVGI